jgi:hypothetical protein
VLAARDLKNSDGQTSVRRCNLFRLAPEADRLKGARSERINDPTKADPHAKALRSRDWDQLKMVGERSHPAR